MFQVQPNSRIQCPQSLPYIRTIPFGSNSTGLMYLQRHYVFGIELLNLKIALKFDCQIVIRLQHMFNEYGRIIWNRDAYLFFLVLLCLILVSLHGLSVL